MIIELFGWWTGSSDGHGAYRPDWKRWSYFDIYEDPWL